MKNKSEKVGEGREGRRKVGKKVGERRYLKEVGGE